MKQYKLTITMPDDFQTGECYACPLSVWDDTADGVYDCVMDYHPCDCPLHETRAVEEDYID